MYRSGLIAFMITTFFVVAVSVSIPVFADDMHLENLLPAHECGEEWIMKDKVILHDKDTLFDHINGEAELYFPYGFDLLATATYVNTKNPELWIVADVYRMGSLLDAFGIYSNYRKSDADGIAVGAESFVSPSQFMFYQNRYFVRLQATGTTDLKRDVFLACGQAISRKLPPKTDYPGELEILRIGPLIPKSERYIAQSLLGYKFFRRGIIADANLNNEKIQIFVVIEDSQAAARNAFSQYCSYLKTDGKDMRFTDTSQRNRVSAIDPLYGGILAAQEGHYIIGAVRLKKVSDAEQLIEQLRRKIVGKP